MPKDMYSHGVSWGKIKSKFEQGLAKILPENQGRAKKIVEKIRNIHDSDIYKAPVSRQIYVILGQAQEIGIIDRNFVQKVINCGFI